MRNFFQNKMSTGLVVGIGLFVFSWMYFSDRVGEYNKFGQILTAQTAEIEMLKSAIERTQTMKSLNVDLRLKLFGNDVMPVSHRSGVLNASILAAARKSNVELGSMDHTPTGLTVRFWGRYPDIERFLGDIEGDLSSVDAYAIEKSKNGGVILTITIPVRS